MSSWFHLDGGHPPDYFFWAFRKSVSLQNSNEVNSVAQNASEEQIRKIVEEVVNRIVADSTGASNRSTAGGDSGGFHSIEDAVQAATQAQVELVAMTLEQRGAIIEAIRLSLIHI